MYPFYRSEMGGHGQKAEGTQGNTFFCGQRAWGWALEALGLRLRCLTKAYVPLGKT